MYHNLPATGFAATAALFGTLGIAVALITLGYMLLAGKASVPARIQRKFRR